MKKSLKIFLNSVGILCIICGIIGIFMPLWPTTPFAIAACMIFAKVNPKIRNKLLNNRFLGPYLENFYSKKGIPMAYKIRTIAFMWAGMVFSMTLIGVIWVQILVTCIGIAVSIHVFVVKTRKTDILQYNIVYNLFSIFLSWIWIALGFVFAETPFEMYRLTIVAVIITLTLLIYGIITAIKRRNANENTNT